MAQVKKGDKVRINYIGKLEDGTVFDSTLEHDDCCGDECETDECDDNGCGCGHEVGPVELAVGEGEMFPQIDEALIGMKPGEKKTLTIGVEDAFGEYDQEKVFTVPRENLPEDMEAEVGDEMVLTNEQDEELGVLVVEVAEDSITFDANHPLAGSDLTYELELLEIL